MYMKILSGVVRKIYFYMKVILEVICFFKIGYKYYFYLLDLENVGDRENSEFSY